MGDCYRQKVRGAADDDDDEPKKVACLQQIGARDLLTDLGSIREAAAPKRLRGGAGATNCDAELGAEVLSSNHSRNKLEQSFEELSDGQQVITSLQLNSKTLSSSFNKRQAKLLGQQQITKTTTTTNNGNNAEQVAVCLTGAGARATGEDDFGAAAINLNVACNQPSKLIVKRKKQRVLDPAGSLYYHWSAVVSFAFLYNFWSLSYRFAFCEIDFDSMAFWFALDYSADIIYTLDIIVNHHTGYLEDGVLERNSDNIGQHYRDCTLFYLDCLCLLPLDILYLSIGFNSILRCSRLVKIYKFWSYVDRTERHTNYPNVFRTITLVHYILVIFHWNACLFHMISKTKLIDIEGLYKISDNRCHDILCQYLHAFYWSTLALTTIGDLPRPRTKGEYVYVTVELFFGLFLFASVLGHVANIVTNVSAARKEFQAKLDAVKTFMRMRRVSDELQNKVIRWFDYLWISQKSSDEERSVACLPDRLKAEIAIHVHLDTLKRVDIFQNTEAGFLCELVLRLKPVLFSPGDYVCRKNEVGHEMYVVSRGILEVVTNEGATVVATLKAGSYFGEISVLNVGLAGNKRTASVRSVGYSDLFCLNKQDLWDVLKNYPNAEARIRARAEERLSKLDIKSSTHQNQQQQQQQYPHQHHHVAHNHHHNNNNHHQQQRQQQQQQQHYLRLPAATSKTSHFGLYQTGSQSLSGNCSGSARHRRRVCSSGSRQRLLVSGQPNNCSSGLGGALSQPPTSKCAADEQVPLGSCYCCRQGGAHHSNMTTCCHLLELNRLARRDGSGASAAATGPLASSFAAASSNNLAPPNGERPSSFGSHSKSLDQSVVVAESSEQKNSAETNMKSQYGNGNPSREGDESDRLVGSTSQNSSHDESPGGYDSRLTSDARIDLSRRGRSRATALKRIGSADEISALRRTTSPHCKEGPTNEELDLFGVQARLIDSSQQQLSSDSSCCCSRSASTRRKRTLANRKQSSFQQVDDSQLASSRSRFAGGSRHNRRQRRGNMQHCCQGRVEQQQQQLYQQPQANFWLAGAQAFQAGSAAPFLQVPLLAAQAADGSYQMLQPVLAGASQSVSMTQLNLNQQVPHQLAKSSTVSPKPFLDGQPTQPSTFNQQRQLASEARFYNESFNATDRHHQGRLLPMASADSPITNASGGGHQSLDAAIATSQRVHPPPLQAAQSGLDGSRTQTDAVVIDTE